MRELLAIGSGLCAAGAATLLTRRATRRTDVRSPHLNQRAARFLAAHGYRGHPEATVDRISGGFWKVTSYQPSEHDKQRAPADHGQEIFRLMEEASKGMPRYLWTDRAHYFGAYVLTLAGIAFATAAAISPA